MDNRPTSTLAAEDLSGTPTSAISNELFQPFAPRPTTRDQIEFPEKFGLRVRVKPVARAGSFSYRIVVGKQMLSNVFESREQANEVAEQLRERLLPR